MEFQSWKFTTKSKCPLGKSSMRSDSNFGSKLSPWREGGWEGGREGGREGGGEGEREGEREGEGGREGGWEGGREGGWES